MKYFSIFLMASCFAPGGFSQSSQTVTLVFVSPPNDKFKNYEAFIDDVSYYSENSSAGNYTINDKGGPANGRNTIWLNNFQPGKHTIQVYKIKDAATGERSGSTPVYSSTFIVRGGFDTKIAVRNNGEVQFSERLSAANNNTSNAKKKDEHVYTPDNNMAGSDTRNSGKKITPGNPDNNEINSNASTNGRHSRKRIDTAVVENDAGNIGSMNTSNDSGEIVNRDNPGENSSTEVQDQNMDNKNSAMDDNRFNQFYETLRNQWRPGQKMKTLTNEFLTAGDNFTTVQAKQLIRLLTEEGNRLRLAKSSYHCIIDPENFKQMDEIFHFKESRDELHNFVSNVANK